MAEADTAAEGIPFIVLLDEDERQNRREEALRRRDSYNRWETGAKYVAVFFFGFYLVSLALLFSPDGSQVAVLTAPTRSTVVVAEGGLSVSTLSWSRSDKNREVQDDDDVTVWDDPDVPRERLANWDDVLVHSRVVKSQIEFDQELSAFPDVIVAFQADWCIWSQRLRPIWQEFAHRNAGSQVIIMEVDCSKSLADLCSRERVLAFPTIRWYRNGQAFGEYKKDRTAIALGNYMKEQLLSSNSIYPVVGGPQKLEPVPSLRSLDAEEDPLHSPKSIKMTLTNFHKMVRPHDSTFVVFYRSGYPTTKPKEWDPLALNLRDSNVVVGHVDCDNERMLCDIEGINGWPEFRWYRYSQHLFGSITDDKNNLVGYMEHVIKMQGKENEMKKGALEAVLTFNAFKLTGPPPCPNATNVAENVAYMFIGNEDAERALATRTNVWRQVKQMYDQDKKVAFRYVYCEEFPRFCLQNQMNTTGIKFYHKGRHILNYNGPIDTVSLPNFLHKMLTEYPFEQEHMPGLTEDAYVSDEVEVEEGASSIDFSDEEFDEDEENYQEVEESAGNPDEEVGYEEQYENDEGDDAEPDSGDIDIMENGGGSFEGDEEVDVLKDYVVEDESSRSSVINVTASNFKDYVEKSKFAFVDFEAPWCVWCQRMKPAWEKFARRASSEGLNLIVGQVDCTAEADLCREQRVMAFPTLRWFNNGKALTPDYKMDRTVEALYSHAIKRMK